MMGYTVYMYHMMGQINPQFFFFSCLTVSAESPLIAAFVAQKMNAGVCGVVHVSDKDKEC